MILGAIFPTLWKIFLTQERDIVITSKARIHQDDGVRVSHPDSGYELWLNGNIDHAVRVIERKKKEVDSEQNWGESESFN